MKSRRLRPRPTQEFSTARRALIGLPLAAFSASAPAAPDLELRLAHYGPENHVSVAAAEQFARDVQQRTAGALRIRLIRNEGDILNAFDSGAVDMGLISWDILGRYSAHAEVIATPFAFKSYVHAHRVVDGEIGRRAAVELAKHDAILLKPWEWGFRQISTAKTPIIRPGDLNGLRIRTPPAPLFQSAINALGAKAVPLPFSELKQALDSGNIDGQENPIAVIFGKKLYESQHHVALLNYIYTSMVHVVRAEVWERLSSSAREVLRGASSSASEFMRHSIVQSEREQIDAMRRSGVHFTTPDLVPFRGAMTDVYAQVRRRLGTEVFDFFLEECRVREFR